MGKHKKSINLCKACGIRHAAPTGAKCDRYRDDSSSSTQGSPRRRVRRNHSGGGSPRTYLGSPWRKTGCNSERSLSGEESPSEVRDKRSLADLLLEKMTDMRDEARAQRMADKAELQKAIADLASRVDCSILCSDDEGAGPAKGTQPQKVLTDGASGTTGDRMTGVSGSGGVMGDPAGNALSNTNAIIVNGMPEPAGGTSFARPAGKKTASFATRVTQHQIQMAGDPISRLCGDETSVAQARIVVGAGGVTLQGIEGTNVQSGYYRTLNNSKVYDVPWPNDFVYRQNGKKASYDSLTIPEFVQGYSAIVVTNIPVMEETKAAIDHVGYLASVMNDTEGGDWEMVLNSHRQILHMVEQAQLKWEDVTARTATRDRQLLRAERAAALPKGVKSQNNVNNNLNIPKGQPCSLFQSGRCSFASHHYSSGQQWIHVCATCV